MHLLNKLTGECTCGHNNVIGCSKCEKCGATSFSEAVYEVLGRPVYKPSHEPVVPERIRLEKERKKFFAEKESLDVTKASMSIRSLIDKLEGRPSFNSVYMQLAIIFSNRSTCSRRKVGCVIVSEDYRRVLSVGYNGNASGLPNCCDEPETSGSCGCLHAEENAAISCSEPRITPKIVFTTTYPCKMCAKRLVQLGGVVKIYYTEDYHDVKASKVFEISLIETERIVFEGE